MRLSLKDRRFESSKGISGLMASATVDVSCDIQRPIMKTLLDSNFVFSVATTAEDRTNEKNERRFAYGIRYSVVRFARCIRRLKELYVNVRRPPHLRTSPSVRLEEKTGTARG